jgi:hypothetical protein
MAAKPPRKRLRTMNIIHSNSLPFLAIDAPLTQLINGQRHKALTIPNPE